MINRWAPDCRHRTLTRVWEASFCSGCAKKKNVQVSHRSISTCKQAMEASLPATKVSTAYSQAGRVLLVCVGLTAFFLTVLVLARRQKEKELGNTKSVSNIVAEVFNGTSDGSFPAVRTLMLSTVSAAVFGFIDNAGLFWGMEAFDPLFDVWGVPEGPSRSGFGNLFSNGFAAFIGAIVGELIKIYTGYDGTMPIYADFLGIVIGCYLGVVVPRALQSFTSARRAKAGA